MNSFISTAALMIMLQHMQSLVLCGIRCTAGCITLCVDAWMVQHDCCEANNVHIELSMMKSAMGFCVQAMTVNSNTV